MPIPAAFPAIAERFAGIIQKVMVAVASRVRDAGSVWHPVGVRIPLAMEHLINRWLMTRRSAIVALMGRIAAGTLRLARPRVPRTAPPDAAPRPRAMPPPEQRRPCGWGWLSAMATEVNSFGCELMFLLEDPAMKAMCLATPRLGQLFAPVLRAMCQRLPDWMPRPERRKRRSQARGSYVRREGAETRKAALTEMRDEAERERRGGGRWFRYRSEPVRSADLSTVSESPAMAPSPAPVLPPAAAPPLPPIGICVHPRPPRDTAGHSATETDTAPTEPTTVSPRPSRMGRPNLSFLRRSI